MSAPTHEYPNNGAQPPHTAPKTGLGIAAMVIGIVAIVLSFIPVVGFLSFVLGPVAVILGIVALVKKRGKGQAIAGIITGALGFLIVTIGTLLFGAAVSSFDDEMQDQDGTEETAEETPEATEEGNAEETSEAAGEEGDEATDDSDAGTRDNPLPIGETFESGDWAVTINDVTLNADDEIASANPVNEPAADGASYTLVNATVVYNGEDSEMIMMGTDIAYVTSSGETVSTWDNIVVAPEPLDGSQELYNGGTETGNVVVAVPDEGEGAIRVRLGLFDTDDAFFSMQ
ncbi:DUF4190 domain-containing protein [Nesterenkonia lutea]|uniref:DUF4190 domain-containing protein n=1 Tax=Nesterenkonia lutea TaxID=272919 RepID=A0ABR9JDB2_9MICC|nr:DUF4190 domain-containing protein [Nesterenkonia lutea]MBE1523914.1 hypothetical protein [Nesterenkonia lutea]